MISYLHHLVCFYSNIESFLICLFWSFMCGVDNKLMIKWDKSGYIYQLSSDNTQIRYLSLNTLVITEALLLTFNNSDVATNADMSIFVEACH